MTVYIVCVHLCVRLCVFLYMRKKGIFYNARKYPKKRARGVRRILIIHLIFFYSISFVFFQTSVDCFLTLKSSVKKIWKFQL